MISIAEIESARDRIAGKVVRTPLVPSPYFSDMAGVPVHLKLESLQPTGAFKLRGAMNALIALDDAARAKGVVCVSTGNHGRAVAYAAKSLGVPATVCLSKLVPQNKVAAIEALGAHVHVEGESQDAAMLAAQRLVETDGLAMIDPFDDPFVASGQGTIGLEIVDDLPDVAEVVVPLSGGGLIAGIAVAVKARAPETRVTGISMDKGAAMYESLRAGHPVEVEEVASLADSLGGGIGLHNRHTFAICRDLLDDVLLVNEEEIYAGMNALFAHQGLVCEGGAAVGVGALLAGKLPKLTGPTVMVITGRSVPPAQFAAVIEGRPVKLGGRTVRGGA